MTVTIEVPTGRWAIEVRKNLIKMTIGSGSTIIHIQNIEADNAEVLAESLLEAVRRVREYQKSNE